MSHQVPAETGWEIPCFDQPQTRPRMVVVKVDRLLGVLVVPPPGSAIVVPSTSIDPFADALKAADRIAHPEKYRRRR